MKRIMNRVMNMKKILSFFCVVLLCLGAESAASATQDPIEMLKSVTDSVMKKLRDNGDSYRSNPSQLYSMVDSLIIPNADFEEASRWVIGREAWLASDENTRKAFSNELKNLAIRTYARSLLNYSGQTIEFMPLRQSEAGKARIQVSSIVKDGNQAPMRLDYRLVRSGDKWKVYDIIIEGVSLMHGYKAQFETAVRENGVQGAIDQIKNSRGGDQ